MTEDADDLSVLHVIYVSAAQDYRFDPGPVTLERMRRAEQRWKVARARARDAS